MDNLQREELSPYWREALEERAAVMQYDAGLSRQQAEAAALVDINKAIQRTGPTFRQALRLIRAGQPAVQVRQMSRQAAGVLIGRLGAGRQAVRWCSGNE